MRSATSLLVRSSLFRFAACNRATLEKIYLPHLGTTREELPAALCCAPFGTTRSVFNFRYMRRCAVLHGDEVAGGRTKSGIAMCDDVPCCEHARIGILVGSADLGTFARRTRRFAIATGDHFILELSDSYAGIRCFDRRRRSCWFGGGAEDRRGRTSDVRHRSARAHRRTYLHGRFIRERADRIGRRVHPRTPARTVVHCASGRTSRR